MFQLQSYLTDHLDHYQTQKEGRYNRQRLLAMDDRSLSDIGVTRGDLIFKVRKQPSPATPRVKALKADRIAQKAAFNELGALILSFRTQPSPAKLRAKALKAERIAQKAAINELRAMSNTDLNDLGISRGDIVEAVRYGRGGLVEQPKSANAARKTTRGEQARAARELASMNDAQLEDIGIIRGDINDLVRNGKKTVKGQTLPGKLANGLFSVFKGPVVVGTVASAAANADSAPKPPRNPQNLNAA